jgi:hypothetical protein
MGWGQVCRAPLSEPRATDTSVVRVDVSSHGYGRGEGNPDAEDVKTTLRDCTVETVGGSTRESCVIDSTDPPLTGSWLFKYEIDTGEDEVTFKGESDHWASVWRQWIRPRGASQLSATGKS